MSNTQHYVKLASSILRSRYNLTCQATLLLILLCFTKIVWAETISINFRDADIRSAVESVAEITGKSFVLDPRVKGKISIISPEPIEEELLYEIFRSSLQVNGFQAVEDGAIVRIVPFTQAFKLADGGSGNKIETRVLKINHVKVADILPSLQPMISNGAQIHATQLSNHIVITDTTAKIERIHQVIRELDTADQTDMEVISMQHLSTGEALHIIGQMNLLDEQKISIVEDQLNNRVIISGPPVERKKFRKLLTVLDVPTNPQPGVVVVNLNHSDAEEMKTLLTSMLESSIFQYGIAAPASEGEASSQYRIEADKASNALVIAAPQVVTDKLNAIIRQLDQPRDQVLIEAIVAEISEDRAKELSIQLSSIAGSGGYLTNFDSILGVLTGLADDEDQVENVATALSASTGLVGAVGDLDGDSSGFFGLITALQSDADTNILSTPSIVTLDNEEATLSVGQEVPFITGSYQTDSSDATNPFQTIEREEVGIKLIVTPQINDGGQVKLAIEQESSNLLASAEALGTADVVTATRKIQTNVLVGDGELLVLGGLIGEDFSRSESKVPFLGSIPLLGNLFKSTSRRAGSSVLMIFIRPTVLKNTQTANRISEDRYRYIRQRQLQWDETDRLDLPSSILEFDRQLDLELESKE